MYDYEHICPNCQKRFTGRAVSFKFCSEQCMKAFRKQAEKAKRTRARTLVDPARCKKCLYSCKVDDITYMCNYMFVTGTPKLLLHPEGLTSDCQEYEPRRGRKVRMGITPRGNDTIPVIMEPSDEQKG